MRKSRQTRPPSGTTARRWIAARHSSGTAATGPPGTVSCCERSKPFEKCGRRSSERGMGKAKRRMANVRWRMTEGRWRMTDAGCRMPDGRGRKAIDEWQMADDECQVADGKLQVARGELKMGDEQCEVEAGGCDEGQSSEPMTEGSSGPVVGYDSQRVTEDATDDKCRLQAEWAPLWETSGYHLSGCGADCSTTLGIKAVRRLDSRPLRDCRADQGRIDSLSGPGPMFR